MSFDSAAEKSIGTDSWSTISHTSSRATSLNHFIDQSATASSSTRVVPPTAAQHLSLGSLIPVVDEQKPSLEHRAPNGAVNQEGTTAKSFEIEETLTASSGGMSWSKRVPWLRSSQSEKSDFSHSLEYNKGGATYYHGGKMEIDNKNPGLFSLGNNQNLPEPGLGLPTKRPAVVGTVNRASSYIRQSSWLTRSSHDPAGEEGSMGDFDDAEWTPPDSSYGAALPIGGWIPKSTRQKIEATLIVLTILCLVYLIVHFSIKVTEENNNHNTADECGAKICFDDDNYIPADDDLYIQCCQAYSDDAVNNNNNENDADNDDVNNDDAAAGDDQYRQRRLELLWF